MLGRYGEKVVKYCKIVYTILNENKLFDLDPRYPFNYVQ